MLAQWILYRAATFNIVWPQFAALALICAVFFAMAIARFRGTIDTMA